MPARGRKAAAGKRAVARLAKAPGDADKDAGGVHGAALWTGTAAAALALQLPWVYPDVPGGDSGELMAEACVLGVAHPPGYPLFVLANHALLRSAGALGQAHAAWVMNALSCACGAAAAGFVALAALELRRAARGAAISRDDALACGAGGLAFALAPLVLTYTVTAEVFALNNALCGALLWLAARVSRLLDTGRVPPGTTLCGAFVCGLALSNQHTSVLFQAPLVAFVLFAAHWPPSPLWLAFAAAFAAGLLPYAHLLAAAPTPGSWGDTTSLSGLVRHVLRQEYGTLRLAPRSGAETEGFAARTLAYAADAAGEELAPPPLLGAGLALLGLAGSLRGPARRTGAVLAAAIGVYLGVFHALANLPLDKPMPREVHRRFWMQPHLVVCVWVAGGLRAARDAARRAVSPAARGLVTAAWRVGAISFVAALAAARAREMRALPSFAVGLYADTLLASLPRDALLGSHTDINWNAVRFKQACASARPDVTHVSFQIMPYPWFKHRQQPLLPQVAFPPLPRGVSTDRHSRANSQLVSGFALANLERGRPVFLDLHSLNNGWLGDDGEYPGGVRLLPHGLLWRVEAATGAIDEPRMQAWRRAAKPHTERVRAALGRLEGVRLPAGSWESAVASILSDALYQTALFQLGWALKRLPAAEATTNVQESASILGGMLRRAAQHGIHASERPRDVAKNAALAASRWLGAASGQRNAEMVAAASEAARECIGVFLAYGNKDNDPAFGKFEALFKALEATA